MERLEYNKLFVDGTQYTDSELRKILDNLKDGEVLELVEVDRPRKMSIFQKQRKFCGNLQM